MDTFQPSSSHKYVVSCVCGIRHTGKHFSVWETEQEIKLNDLKLSLNIFSKKKQTNQKPKKWNSPIQASHMKKDSFPPTGNVVSSTPAWSVCAKGRWGLVSNFPLTHSIYNYTVSLISIFDFFKWKKRMGRWKWQDSGIKCKMAVIPHFSHEEAESVSPSPGYELWLCSAVWQKWQCAASEPKL